MSQNIIPTAAGPDFPACAISCAVLLAAQQVCEPPYQAATNQLTYDTCFCNSASLTPFATTPDALCTAECTVETDRVLLQQWFNGFCAQVKAGVDPVSTRTQATVTATTARTTQTTATGPLTLSTTTLPYSTGAASSSSGSGQQSWIDTHWKYMLMIIIIIVGLLALLFIGIYLKKRHRRKLEQERAAASGFNVDPEKRSAATPNLWGPHQAQNATQGYMYETGGAVPTESLHRHSRRAKSGVNQQDVVETAGSSDGDIIRPTSSGRRARPSELEKNARMIGAADRRSKSQKGSRRRKHEDDTTSSSRDRSASESRSRRRSRPRRRNSDPEQARRQ